MREIEVKVRLDDAKAIAAKLAQMGASLSPKTKQHDVVYCLPGSKTAMLGVNWLRLQTENDSKTTFTLKRSVTRELDSIEHETIVGNEQEMTKILKYMGYEVYSDLTKIRRKTKLGDIEICLDEVPGLGTFMEAEKLCAEDSNYQTVADELWELCNKLGVTKQDEVTSGYDVLMRQSQGLDS